MTTHSTRCSRAECSSTCPTRMEALPRSGASFTSWGMFYVTNLPNRYSYTEKVARLLGLYYHGQLPDDRVYSKRTAGELLERHGFQVKKSYGSYTCFHSPSAARRVSFGGRALRSGANSCPEQRCHEPRARRLLRVLTGLLLGLETGDGLRCDNGVAVTGIGRSSRTAALPPLGIRENRQVELLTKLLRERP